MSFLGAHPIAVSAVLLVAAAATVILRFVIKIHRNDPTVWAGEMRRFDEQDRRDGAPSNVIVFTGSQIDDVTHYAGENDMAGVLWSRKKKPEEVHDAFRDFCEKILAAAPTTPIYFISIKPPKRRIAEWPGRHSHERAGLCDLDFDRESRAVSRLRQAIDEVRRGPGDVRRNADLLH